MLVALRAARFAIIDALEVRFGPGLNVLTGETGAGKSILVDALHLALGGRAWPEVVRSGAEEATVEALFEPADGPALDAALEALGLPAAGGELVVRRTVAREGPSTSLRTGRSRAWVNGAMVTAAQLAQVARGLVDICGQHEHVSLMDPASHLSLLDAYAALAPELAAYRTAYDALASAEGERRALAADEAERAARLDYLRFQLEEIEKLDPRPGEDEALAAERRILAGAEKLRAASEAAESALYSGEAAAVDAVGQALARVEEAAAIDPGLGVVAGALRGALAEISEAARTLGRYAARAGGDPDRLGAIDERLDELRRLCRKHGGDVTGLLARRDAMRQEVARTLGSGERLSELGAQIERLAAEARGRAAALTARRREAAGRLGREAAARLAQLGMARTLFEARLGPLPEDEAAVAGLGPRGADHAELFISPNPGEEPRPMARIASGGELSRVLLALKCVLAERDPVPTYVFDEVDSGIGGATADVVGRLLKEVSRGRQVLCITHLPQIAAHADAHYAVTKAVQRGRTQAAVAPLAAGEERCAEVARMLGGAEITGAARQHAAEMIERAAPGGVVRALAGARGRRRSA